MGAKAVVHREVELSQIKVWEDTVWSTPIIIRFCSINHDLKLVYLTPLSHTITPLAGAHLHTSPTHFTYTR